jgi:class 3 adenylate cyclase
LVIASKLLRAIANLQGIEKGTVAVPATPPAASPPVDAVERRQVTVMFSDLVGSTALADRIDPEDLCEVFSAYQKCVARPCVALTDLWRNVCGDGVLVCFGYPWAHEDDAERAVRAGLELMAAVAGIKTHVPLQTRPGIATGLVVVGALIGSGDSQKLGIVGETPNIAARLKSIAEPNTAVMAEGTRSSFRPRDSNRFGLIEVVKVIRNALEEEYFPDRST